jgi:Glycogen recognition site of AMP-activated protein kinase
MSKSTRKQKKTGIITHLAKSEPIKVQAAQTAAVKPNPSKVEPAKPSPTFLQAARTEPTKAPPSKAAPTIGERPRVQPPKPEPERVPGATSAVARTEPMQPQALLAQAAKVQPVIPEPPKPVVAPSSTPRPEVARVSLELVRPEAKRVCVAGSFNGWQPDRTPLRPLGNGHWVGDLTVKPGRHEYLFVVDGQWVPDPNATETVRNPFGGRNSVLTVRE